MKQSLSWINGSSGFNLTLFLIFQFDSWVSKQRINFTKSLQLQQVLQKTRTGTSGYTKEIHSI